MEMNMHMPQNVLAETELRELAAIPYQAISPASNAPIIGIYQDSLLGSYRLTRPNIDFTPLEAMNLLMMYPHVRPEELRKEDGKKLSSFEVLSQIMPPLSATYKTKSFKEGKDDYGYNARTEVFENLLQAGVLDPTKVARIAIENAASIAAMLLTTECVIVDEPEKDKGAAGRPGGMPGGMPGMM